MKHIVAVALLAISIAACRSEAPAPDGKLDAVARDYVALSLAIGEKEDGYIDAY